MCKEVSYREANIKRLQAGKRHSRRPCIGRRWQLKGYMQEAMRSSILEGFQENHHYNVDNEVV